MNHNDRIQFTDFTTKKSYEVPNHLQPRYPLYQYRFILGVSMGILIWSLGTPVIVSLGVSALFTVLSEWMYRKSFLPKCNAISPLKNTTKSLTKQSLILNAVLYLLVSVGLIILITNQSFDKLSTGILIAMACLTIASSISYVISIIKE